MAATNAWIQENLEKDMDWIKNFTDSIVNRFGNGLKAYDMEDMYQEASIAYWQACQTYEEGQNTTLFTYARRRIYWALKEFLGSNYMKAIYNEAFDGLKPEELDMAVDDPMEQVEDAVCMEEVDKLFQHAYRSTKSKCVRYGILAIRAEAGGMEKKEIADQLGVTPNYLSVCRSRACKVLEPYREEFIRMLDAG